MRALEVTQHAPEAIFTHIAPRKTDKNQALSLKWGKSGF